MIDKLESLDQQLFLWLNSRNNDTFDSIMYWVSEVEFWIPVYLLVLYLVWKKWGTKVFLLFFFGIALTVTLCDRISVELFKEVFQRWRPCHNLDLQDLVHTVKKCGGKFSFVSSHATNYFGIAVLSSLFLKTSKATWLLLIWAALIGYSRIYLGVHYPADVVCGSLLGAFLGWFAYRVCLLIMKRYPDTFTANATFDS